MTMSGPPTFRVWEDKQNPAYMGKYSVAGGTPTFPGNYL